MNASKFLSTALIAVASISAGSVFAADDGGLPVPATSVSTLSRAQVRADYAQAVRAGQLPQGEARNFGEDTAVASHSALTRAEVRAEAIQANKTGESEIRS